MHLSSFTPKPSLFMFPIFVNGTTTSHHLSSDPTELLPGVHKKKLLSSRSPVRLFCTLVYGKHCYYIYVSKADLPSWLSFILGLSSRSFDSFFWLQRSQNSLPHLSKFFIIPLYHYCSIHPALADFQIPGSLTYLHLPRMSLTPWPVNTLNSQ